MKRDLIERVEQLEAAQQQAETSALDAEWKYILERVTDDELEEMLAILSRYSQKGEAIRFDVSEADELRWAEIIDAASQRAELR